MCLQVEGHKTKSDNHMVILTVLKHGSVNDGLLIGMAMMCYLILNQWPRLALR